MWSDPRTAYPAIALLLVVAIALITYNWWWPHLRHFFKKGRADQQIKEAVISQKSLFVGAIISFLVGLFGEYFAFASLFQFAGIDQYILAHMIGALLLGIPLYILGLHNIPTGYRGAIVILGKRRLRKSGQGLSEGYQWTLLFVSRIEDVDCRWKIMDVSDKEGMYCADGAQGSTEASQRYRRNDVYRSLGIEKAEETLKEILLQSQRILAKDMPLDEFILTDKVQFSEKVAMKARETMNNGDPENDTLGLDVGQTIVADIYATSDDVNSALNSLAREKAQGKSERVQADRRIDQIEIFKKAGLSPELAVAAAQIEVEKKGATMTTINVPGAQDLMEAGVTLVERLLPKKLEGGTNG